MGNLWCCNTNNENRKIVLLLVGLDNAGKSVAVKGLAGEPLDTVVPTVGLSVVRLKYKNYKITIFDLGGGANIRGIWERYFVDTHGIIFVVDSSDYYRLDEAHQVLKDLLSHEKISGKPLLLLANKQDQQEALDELDLVDKLDLERLVNKRKCPTLVETCSATETSSKSKIDPGIRKGYYWLLNFIVRDYERINTRVEKDVKQQQIEEEEERVEKITRLRQLNAENKRVDVDLIESYTDYVNGNASNLQANNLNDQKDLILIHNSNYNANGETRSYSSSKSNESSPYIYYNENLVERPKSATQLVKEQIELNSNQRKISFKSVLSNKTAPVNLYGHDDHPRSAYDRRENFINDRRTLKSAGDSNYISSFHGPTEGASMDETHNELFQLNNFNKAKLPPIVRKTQSCDGEKWAHKSNVSIINLQ